MEYIETSDPEFDRIASMMPDCCIVEIKKVLDDLQCFYNRNDIEDKKTREMFHGTKSKFVNNILSEGLRSYANKISAYGKGTYFSPDIKLSLFSYTDKDDKLNNELSYVFLCDVIVDETKGNGSNIYVCPRDDSFRIKYLISFYKV